MIWDSAPWRTDLIRDADLIEAWAKRPHKARQRYILEKKIFVTAFSIRKLFESRKIKDSDAGRSVKAYAFPTISIPPRYHWGDLDQYFEMDAFKECKISAMRLSNALIHSFIFTFIADEAGNIGAFFLASDQTRKTKALKIEIPIYAELCRKIATSHPTKMESTFNDNSETTVVT